MELSFRNVDQLCNNIDIENQEPVIDLSNITFFLPFALVYLGQFIRYHSSLGKSILVTPPTNTKARTYLAQQNFWNRFNLQAITKLRAFGNSTSLNDIVDIEKRPDIAEETARNILDILVSEGVDVDCGLVTEVVSELVDNFAEHSLHSLATLAMQYYPTKHKITIAIGDCGIGIRASLCKNPQYSYLTDVPHYEAIIKALEPLVSVRTDGGMGLTQVSEQIHEANGELILATGDGYVILNRHRTIKGDMAYNLCGVQIQISFPTGR